MLGSISGSMKSQKIDLLIELLRNPEVTTVELAGRLSISQQSASRWVRELQEDGYLEARGRKKVLAKKALERMERWRTAFNSLLEKKREMRVKGDVFTGKGEGKYYISREGYAKQFKEKMGFAPRYGTLNLRLEDWREKARLSEEEGVIMEGFEAEGRTFGALKAFPATVGGFEAAAIIPERSFYGMDVLEIVSEKNLRKALGLEEGSPVEVKITIPP